MPMTERLAGLVVVMAVSGCYSATEGGAVVEESGLLESGDGGSSGSSLEPVPVGRGLLEDNDFQIDWEHYEVWEEGACTRIHLQNEGRAVRGWQMAADLSEEITNWLDSGGAFMWLAEDRIFIEQEDDTELESWQSTSMYYCAEPAVLIEDVSVTFREGTPDDGWEGDASTSARRARGLPGAGHAPGPAGGVSRRVGMAGHGTLPTLDVGPRLAVGAQVDEI